MGPIRLAPRYRLAVLAGVGVGVGVLVLLSTGGTAGASAAPADPGPLPSDPTADSGAAPTPYQGDPHTGDGGGRHRTPTGQRYAVVRTPVFADRCSFVTETYSALLAAGLPSAAALLFVGHLARETGWGQQGMWNNAPGNVKQYGDGPWHRLSDGEPYKTFLTYADGIADNVGLIRGNARYASAWAMLLSGDPNWYGELGRHGYYESDPTVAQVEYDGELARIHTCLGV